MDYAKYAAGKAAYYVTSHPRNTFAVSMSGITHGYQYAHVSEVVFYSGEEGQPDLIDIAVADRLISIIGRHLAAVADGLIEQQIVRVQPWNGDESDEPQVESIVVEVSSPPGKEQEAIR